MSSRFYDRAKLLDKFKALRDPDVSDVARLLRILKTDSERKYFFTDLSNPRWIGPLHVHGAFDKPPDPELIEGEGYRLPAWYEGEYLGRFAKDFVQTIVEIAKTVRTENSRVHLELLKAATSLGAATAAECHKPVCEWLTYRFADVLIWDVGGYLQALLAGDFVKEALAILAVMLEPRLPSSRQGESPSYRYPIEPKPRFDLALTKEVILPSISIIVDKRPEAALRRFERLLLKSIRQQSRASRAHKAARLASYWRSAIETHPQNSGPNEHQGLLVDAIRDSLVSVAELSTAKGGALLERYLASDHSILRRLAIHTLRAHAPRYSELFEGLFTSRTVLDDVELHHELYWLLSDQFTVLRKKTRTRLVRWIFDGPKDPVALQRRLADADSPADLETKARTYAEYWSFRRLWGIQAFLRGKHAEMFRGFRVKYGEPDHPDFLSWHSPATWLKHTPPVSAEEMVAKQPSELLHTLQTYDPPTTSSEHSREGLAEALKSAASQDPHSLGRLAPQLGRPDILPIYLYHYLWGMREAVDRGETPPVPDLLDLCEYVVTLKEAPESSEHEPYAAGARAAQWEVAHLIESFLKSRQGALDQKQLDRIATLIEALLENPDPAYPEALSANWDPATSSLNTVRGQAMHCVMRLARYVDDARKSAAGSLPHVPHIDSRLLALLERKLDKSNDPSLAVHAVYGWHFPMLHYLDSAFATTHLDAIFPREGKLASYWRAAWDAYVSFNNVYVIVFKLLLPYYSRALKDLNDPKQAEQLGAAKADRMSQHILFGYIHGLIGWDTEDALMKDLYTAASDEVRGQAGFWLGQALESLQPAAGDPIWLRFQELWRRRIREAANGQAGRGYTHELSSYVRWLAHVPVDLRELEDLLALSLPHIKEGFFKKVLLEYVARWAQLYPVTSSQMLLGLLRSSETFWGSIYNESIGEILKACMSSGDETAKAHAIDVINLLGERGEFAWKEFLPVH